jgi:hypothetical protein
MKVGDLVKWSWHPDTWMPPTHFMGVIVNSKLFKRAGYVEGFKCIVLEVLINNGQLVQVREDEATLELINVS